MWPATVRVVQMVQPRYCFFENVPGLLAASHGYFGTILRDLNAAGYSVKWVVLSAADAGAPHLRKRLWIVATKAGRHSAVKQTAFATLGPDDAWQAPRPSLHPARADTVPYREKWPTKGMMQNGKCYPLQTPEHHVCVNGSGSLLPSASSSDHNDTQDGACPWPTPRAGTDTMCGGSGHKAKLKGTTLEKGRGQLDPDWVELLMGWPRGWSSLEPMDPERFQRWFRGFVEHPTEYGRYGAVPWLDGTWEADQPRVSTGVPNRMDRLKAIGNGQVPCTAMLAWLLLADDKPVVVFIRSKRSKAGKTTVKPTVAPKTKGLWNNRQ